MTCPLLSTRNGADARLAMVPPAQKTTSLVPAVDDDMPADVVSLPVSFAM